MTLAWFVNNTKFGEEKWPRMVAFSFLFHLAILSVVLFVPQNTVSYPSIGERVYHVELVGPPSTAKGRAQERAVAKKGRTSRISKTGAKRITTGRKRTVPLVTKRISAKPQPKPEESALSSSGLIEEAISKIEKKVLREEAAQTTEQETVQPKEEEAVQSAETRGEPEGEMSTFSPGEVGAHFGTSSGVGKVIALYQIEIEAAIKNNWTYPVALVGTKKGKMPEAVVILTVKNDGKILKHGFKKRSHDPLFDDSVMKAVEKSDPLPPFPPGYKKRYEEVEINFSLKDLV
jgi:colicin import membrane protein